MRGGRRMRNSLVDPGTHARGVSLYTGIIIAASCNGDVMAVLFRALLQSGASWMGKGGQPRGVVHESWACEALVNW